MLWVYFEGLLNQVGFYIAEYHFFMNQYTAVLWKSEHVSIDMQISSALLTYADLLYWR